MLAEIVGKFLGDSKYSEPPSLSQELATDMASLSVLTGCMGVAVGPPVGRACFDFFDAPNCCGCGRVEGGSISEPVGREGGAGDGR